MPTAERKLAFYIGLQGRRQGPLGLTDMARLIETGHLDPAAMINVDGREDWLVPSQVPELAPLFSAGVSAPSSGQAAVGERPRASTWLAAVGTLLLIGAVTYISISTR